MEEIKMIETDTKITEKSEAKIKLTKKNGITVKI